MPDPTRPICHRPMTHKYLRSSFPHPPSPFTFSQGLRLKLLHIRSSFARQTQSLPADFVDCIQQYCLPMTVYSSCRSAAKPIARQPFTDTELPWLFSLANSSAISLPPDKSRQRPPSPFTFCEQILDLRSSDSISPSPLASSTSTTAADLPADILNCIQKRLPLDDYLRFPSVCSSWRSAATRIAHQPFSDPEFPWLFSLHSLTRPGGEFASAVSLSPDNSLPPRTYSIPVPQRFRGSTIISSNSHCLMLENTKYHLLQDHNSSGIYIVNPFDSWSQLGRLPSSSTLSANPANYNMCKRIVRIAMNTAVAVAVVGIFDRHLAYTRLGSDNRWIDLRRVINFDSFQDVVTYKDGLFCAVDRLAHKVYVLDFSSPTVTFKDMTLNLPPYEENNGWACFQQARFVNSSSKLFLVRWRNLIKRGEKKRREVDVYKLMDDDDDAGKKWVPMKSLDNFSFFLGTNQSMSLSTADFPRLRSNCIYIPHDAIYRLDIEDCSVTLDDDDDDFRSQLIYDLGDGSWGEYYSCEEFNGLWMTPRFLSNCAS